MRKFKQLLAYGLVAVMSFSLVACGTKEDSDKDDDDDDKKKSSKKVTVESLLEDIPTDKLESLTADVKFDLDFGMDLRQAMLDQGLSEDDIEAAIEEGSVTEDLLDMKLTAEMNFTAEITDEYMHMSGDMDMNAAGQEESTSMESYTDYTDEDTKLTYTYDPEAEEWYVSEEDVEEDDDEIPLEDFSDLTEYFKEAEITDESDDAYVLEVVLDLEKISEAESEAMDEFIDGAADSADEYLGDSEELISSIDELTVIVEIDKDSNYITSIKLDLVDMFEEIIKDAAKENEEVSAYVDYISINDFSIEITFDDYNKTEVEIPEDVIENAVEETFDTDIDWDEDDWDDSDWDDIDDSDLDEDGNIVLDDDIIGDDSWENNDDDSVVVNGDTVDLYSSNDTFVTTITIPDSYEVDTDYSYNSSILLSGDNWNSVTVASHVTYWVEDLMNGEGYEADLEFYTRDEASEVESIKTNQGTVRVFINTWSFDENPTEEFTQTIVYVLELSDGTFVSVEGYVYEIEESGYTIESFIQTILQ